VEMKEPDRGVFVMKRSSGLGQEVLGSLLALRLGISTPKLRIVDLGSDEGQAVLDLIATSSLDPAGFALASFGS
jgi:hypothetical protein